MSGLAASIVAMLQALLPLLSSTGASTISTIIAVLVQLIPEAVKEVEAVGPIITQTIAALRSNTAITPDQLTALEAVEDQYDAAFEAAATAAGAPSA